MKLISSILLSSAAALVAVSAQAADLPSKKAAPASYVKICDAYGAGFFYIPGTDTCVKLGGYVRAEYQYTPGQKVYTLGTNGNTTLAQVSSALDSTGMEMRGRLEADARTATPWGTARTFVRLRMTNQTGERGNRNVNNSAFAINTSPGNQTPTLEAALVQWAGFTFGIAPENYAFMPSMFYHSNPWTGFPNGQKQLAYTATFGGGLSATIAIEDKTEWSYTGTPAAGEYVNSPTNGYNLVGNVKWDQPWGFAVLHGAVSNNSLRSDYATTAGVYSTLGSAIGSYNALVGPTTFSAYAVGATVMYNLNMLAPGDKLWVSANYTKGMLGAILSGGGLSVLSTASNKRFLGGIGRADQNLVVTSGAGTAASPYTIGSTTGWNVAAALTHYWTANWRSNFDVGYVEVSPPTSTLTQWGKGREWVATGSIIFSPAKDFDIGLELQYINLKSSIQNPSAAYVAAGSPGLSESGWSSKIRVERAF